MTADSDNYVVRRIGDRFITIDSDGKLTTNGDYPNESSYIGYGPQLQVSTSIFENLEAIPEELVPMGFDAQYYNQTCIATSSSSKWFIQ